MTTARWSIAAVFIALTLLTGINFAIAQVAVKADDLIGTWELVSTKDLKRPALPFPAQKARALPSNGCSLRVHIGWSSPWSAAGV
jgi:hypothetical protein